MLRKIAREERYNLLLVQSVGGDFYVDTLFNPTWTDDQSISKPWNNAVIPWNDAYYGTQRVYTADLLPSEMLTPSPPFLPQDLGSSPSSGAELSPPHTGVSTMANLGSAGLHSAFVEDPEFSPLEPSPDFIRWILCRSDARRQERMGNTAAQNIRRWAEHSYAEPEPSSLFVTPPRPTSKLPGSEFGSPQSKSSPESRTTSTPTPSTPSRLSRRVRPPPPIHTDVISDSMMASRAISGGYEVEVGQVDGTALSGGSGFEADDEHDATHAVADVCAATSPDMLCRVDGGDLHVDGCAFVPERKSYAAVVASSPPASEATMQGNVPSLDQDPMRGGPSAYGWRPLIELSDA